MANHLALQSFCQSLCDVLAQRHAAFAPSPGIPALPPARFAVLSSTQLSSPDPIPSGTVSLFLHRVTPNNHLRNPRVHSGLSPLGVDLHLLLTVWADEANDEHILFAWVMRELHEHALLDRSSLSADARWAEDEQINITPAELPPDELNRLWRATGRGYRLSFPFIARMVRLDADQRPNDASIVPPQLSIGDQLKE